MYQRINIIKCRFPIRQVPSIYYYVVAQKHYLRFRYILQHQHTHYLPSTLSLCTFLIKSSTNNYYALMLRKKIINHQIKQLVNNDKNSKRVLLQRELKFMNNLLQDNPKEYHVWTYKKDLISTMIQQHYPQNSQQPNIIIKHQIYTNENKFIFQLLIQDCRNYHAWDYRFWLVSYLGKIEQELQWIDDLISYQSVSMNPLIVEQMKIEKSDISIRQLKINWIQVNSLWSHRFNLIKYIIIMRQNSEKKLTTMQCIDTVISKELQSVVMWLKINRKNQPLWNYLSGLVKMSQQQQSQQSSLLTSSSTTTTTTNEVIEHNLNLLFDYALIQILQVQHMNRFELSFLKKHIKHFKLNNENQIKLTNKILNQLKTIDQTREKTKGQL